MPNQICLISPTFPPDFVWDPVSRDSLELAMALKENGHSISVLALGRVSSGQTVQNGLDVYRIDMPAQEPEQKVNLIQETTPHSRMALRSAGLFYKEFFKLNCGLPFDVVIAPDYLPYGLLPALAGGPAFLLQSDNQLPEFIAEQINSAGNSPFSLDEKLTEFLCELNRDLCDGFVYESSRQTNGEADSGKPVSIIPHCLDTNHFSPSGKKAIDTKERKSVALLGRIDSAQSISFLQQLLPALRSEIENIHISLIIDNLAFEDREFDVKKSLSAQSIEVDSLINSRLCRNLMPAVWRSHHVVCMLPYSQHNIYSFLEPMASGVVVVSPTNAVSSALKANTNGIFFEEETKENYAKHVKDLLKDDAKREKIADNARLFVEERFSRQVAGKNFEAAIAEAIERRVSPKGIDARGRIISTMGDRLTTIVGLYRQMLYDFLFVRSLRFKLKHWARRVVSKTAAKN